MASAVPLTTIEKGWGIIAPPGIAADADLNSWIKLAMEFVKGLKPKSAVPKPRNKKPAQGD